jgi:UDP-N-acetylmuramoyl-L-alanyl-D-glutamate--2,6-diaminopimelate ligase
VNVTSDTMHFSTLIAESAFLVKEKGGSGDPKICDIEYDSRKCRAGALYCAVSGMKKDGNDFIGNAIENGAVAVVTEKKPEKCSVPWVCVDGVRGKVGRLGKILWGNKADHTFMVGITGTNGKTTVAHLYRDLLETVHPEEPVWMFGTIEFQMGDKKNNATHTTPEALEILRSMHNEQQVPGALVMEVSSHSLALDRVGGLQFDIAVFTNLTQDHLDFHKDMETYYAAKKKLFTDYLKKDGLAVINIDDPYGKRLADELTDVRKVTFGFDTNADCRICTSECEWSGCAVGIEMDAVKRTFTTELCGAFNIQNMTACIAGALKMGCSADAIDQSLAGVVTVNGRMERIATGTPFTVVVDYAHTPDALKNVLRAARGITTGRLFCVFGCGGDRDRGKRPLMGAAASVFCDEAWITSDNPRSENPQTIISEIIDGIPLDFSYRVEPDRKKAIAAALEILRDDDCLVVAGKGHETYQEINGIRNHFDDKEVINELLRMRGKKGTENVM